jgi:hypothetical protein
MRKALPIIVVAAIVGIGFQAMGGPPVTIAESKMTNPAIQNGVSVYGLRVALPENMTTFPKELVALP